MKVAMVFGVVLSVMTAHALPAPAAVCPDGRSAVIIVTPGGRQQAICVSDRAAKGVGIAGRRSAAIKGPFVDLAGSWFFFNTAEGSLYVQLQHMTLDQTASTLTLTATCDEGFPVGTGAVYGTDFSAFFDFGDGGGFSVAGEASATLITGTFTTPDSGGTFWAERAGALDCGLRCEPVAVPRFVTSDYVDLTLFEKISRLRSGFGHDYSDSCESCRSMKHYYYLYDENRVGNGMIEIRAPVDGVIVEVADEQHGDSSGLVNREMFIQSSLHPEVHFILSHVDLLSTAIAVGKEVVAGELLGHARIYYPELGELAWGTEIAVLVQTPYGERFVSFFDTMDDALFASYQARGLSARSAAQIGREERDADALACIGEEFVGGGTIENWVYLGLP